MTQIAVDGGLLPSAIVRNSLQIWPAKRREVVVDFARYMDGRATSNGDVIYLANTLYMPDGRKPVFSNDGDADNEYCVPMLKIIIDGDAEDNSVMPRPARCCGPCRLTCRRRYGKRRGSSSSAAAAATKASGSSTDCSSILADRCIA
jgi:hypothetical protein